MRKLRYFAPLLVLFQFHMAGTIRIQIGRASCRERV